MGQPIATAKKEYTCFAFPDVCLTPSPSGQVPIPYPNIGYLSDATDTSAQTGEKGEVKVAGANVILTSSSIPDQKTTGDEAGTGGGVKSGSTKGAVKFTAGSQTVKIHGS